MRPRSTARAALMIPATPAAPSRCPMLVFTDPTYKLDFRLQPMVLMIALASRGSPAWVPVPSRAQVSRMDGGYEPGHTVRFNITGLCRVHSSLSISGSNKILLRFCIGQRDTRRSSIFVRCRSEDDCTNGVTVTQGSIQWLQDSDAETLASEQVLVGRGRIEVDLLLTLKSHQRCGPTSWTCHLGRESWLRQEGLT